jgi:hypothetical protein
MRYVIFDIYGMESVYLHDETIRQIKWLKIKNLQAKYKAEICVLRQSYDK